MEEKEKRRIVHIDALNIFFQHLQKNSARDNNMEPLGGFVGTINFIQKICSKFRAEECYVVFDGPNAGFRRKQIHKEYKDKRGRKNGRVISLKLNEEQIVKVNNEEYQMELLLECLKRLPVKIVTAEFYEADDIISYLVSKHSDDLNIVCSMDRDYLQLISDNCLVYSPQKQILYDKDMIKEVYKVPIENFLYYRTVIGDSSDHLIGLKGFKEKTLLELFPAIKEEKFETINDFINGLKLLEESKSKNITKLKNSEEQLLLMYRLMKLSPEFISLKAKAFIDGMVDEQKQKTVTKYQFKNIAVRVGLINYLKEFDKWYRPFFFLVN